MVTHVISVENDYKKAYEEIKAKIEAIKAQHKEIKAKQKANNQKKYAKNKEAVKARSLEYYYAHRDEINRKKSERARASREYMRAQKEEEEKRRAALAAELSGVAFTA